MLRHIRIKECVVNTAAVYCWCIVFASTNFTQLVDTERKQNVFPLD